jgi:3',5'-cyclic AMP phosphodiesterase CpdA
MRIALTSDIHFHPPWADRAEALVGLIQEQAPDLLILAGDIGEPLEMFEQGLVTFEPACECRAALPGNHDVWHRVSDHTSQALWDSLLKQTSEAHGYHWLERENLVVDSIGICGTVAWYDYSGKQPALPLSDDQYERLKTMISNDGRFIDWPWRDREFAHRVGVAFLERLDALENDSQVTDVIAVTHVPLFKECLRPVSTPEHGIANAYYANLPLGEAVLQRRKVRALFSGHVHLAARLEVNRGDSGPLLVCNVPADYGKPAALIFDTGTQEVKTVQPEIADPD